jgi:hypothetical protein
MADRYTYAPVGQDPRFSGYAYPQDYRTTQVPVTNYVSTNGLPVSPISGYSTSINNPSANFQQQPLRVTFNQSSNVPISPAFSIRPPTFQAQSNANLQKQPVASQSSANLSQPIPVSSISSGQAGEFKINAAEFKSVK